MKLHSLFLVLGFLCFFVGFSHADNFKLYTVKRGDSLSAIAYHFHISESSIESINKNINWLKIMPGQKIFVPMDANANPEPGTIGNGYYVVKRGDTLGTIANRFGISLHKLLSLNLTVSKIIKPGELIFIPKSITNRVIIAKQNGIRYNPVLNRSLKYTVRNSDTLESIAYKFGISIEKLKVLNNLRDSVLRIGEIVFIPRSGNIKNIDDFVKLARKEKKFRTKKQTPILEKLVFKIMPKPGTIGNGYYVVKRGDTLGAIAAMLGLTLKELMSLNPSVSAIIKPGEIIRIPKEISKKIKIARDNGIFISPRYLNFCRVYRVQSGDSLWSISHKFGIGIDIVKMLNNLNSNLLRVGEVLFVPNKNLAQTKKMEIALSILHSERGAVVSFAKRFLGTPYVWGGVSLTQGVDCSGFVQQIYRRFGIYLPRTAQEQYYSPIGIPVKLSQLQPGDLLFFHTMSYTYVTHVAMYIGHGKIIEALNPRTGVIIANLNNRYYMKRFIGAKQILSIRRLARYGYLGNRSG